MKLRALHLLFVYIMPPVASLPVPCQRSFNNWQYRKARRLEMGYVIALHEGSCSLVVGAQHSLIRRTFMKPTEQGI